MIDICEYMIFTQEYLAEFCKPHCDVYNRNGNIIKYCPEEVTHVIKDDGDELHLCEQCYKTYLLIKKDRFRRRLKCRILMSL